VGSEKAPVTLTAAGAGTIVLEASDADCTAAGALPLEPLCQPFFVSVIFDTGLTFCPGRLTGITSLLFVFPCVAKMTGMHHHTQPLVEIRIS
jgi:hypothetical protein